MLLKAFTKEARSEDWELNLGHALPAYGATVHALTVVSPLKMPTGREVRVPSNVFLPFGHMWQRFRVAGVIANKWANNHQQAPLGLHMITASQRL